MHSKRFVFVLLFYISACSKFGVCTCFKMNYGKWEETNFEYSTYCDVAAEQETWKI